ncbi:GIP [Symbiodinium natans]|uniref:GIP protein n=1 Tax=Symbiodinium natans TaxID=878477 RepID=A0A812MTU0_9DINO|nr:GIP [Symbiodinium natans]
MQHLVCRQTRQVFMDRMCIEQNDPELKKKGIMGLAGFLKLSKRLVVLWSPRYFTRLWCVYEIATWTKLRKSLRQIIIAPVAQGVFVVLVMSGVFVVMVLLTALAQLESWELYSVILGLVTATIMIAPLYAVRNLVCDLRVMKAQIEGFSFMSAECYCCRVGHLIPDTNTRIPCDRHIIGDKLEEWFGPQSSGVIRHRMAKELCLALSRSGTRGTTGESAEELFDRYVQGVFGRYILKKVGGTRVSYDVAVATTLPAFFYVCDRLHLLTTLQPREQWRLIAHYAAVILGFFPSLVRLALDMTLLADYLLRIRIPLPTNLWVMLLATAILTGITFLWLFLLDYSLFHDQVLFQILVNSASIIATVGLYYSDLSDLWTRLKRSRKQRFGRMKTRRTLRPSRRESGESGPIPAGMLHKGKSWQPVPETTPESPPTSPKPKRVTFGKTVPALETAVLPGAPMHE